MSTLRIATSAAFIVFAVACGNGTSSRKPDASVPGATGGAPEGTGGATSGIGGSTAVGTGGMVGMGGTGGTLAGTGGTLADTGGTLAGTGGSLVGTGGSLPGTGGSAPAAGGVVASGGEWGCRVTGGSMTCTGGTSGATTVSGTGGSPATGYVYAGHTFSCQALPAGDTDGCALPAPPCLGYDAVQVDVDAGTEILRFPLGCVVTLGPNHPYYPGSPVTEQCYKVGTDNVWTCLM